MSPDIQAAQAAVAVIAEKLRARGQSFGLAESCTGGMVSSLVTDLAGISDVYMGSVVAYANHVKEGLLGVPGSILTSSGAVSLPCAQAMARGARAALRSDWAVSITGIAGPSGGTTEKPVGTVCFGISGPGIEAIEAVEQRRFNGNRREIREASVRFALEMLLRHLS